MSKITEYPKVQTANPNDILLLDGSAGTRTIEISDLATLIQSGMKGMVIPTETRRGIWRGKNLGSAVTEEQHEAIQNGTFDDLFLGDYWEINEYKWRIMDFDYFINTGDRLEQTHHIIIMPDGRMYNGVMNDTKSAEGGYVGSKMRAEGLNTAKNTIYNAFGESNILVHREQLVNAIDNDGYISGVAFYDCDVEIPSEMMFFGSFITSSYIPVKHSDVPIAPVNKFSAINFMNNFINVYKPNLGWCNVWFREPGSKISFSSMWDYYKAGCRYADRTLIGVLPYFALK